MGNVTNAAAKFCGIKGDCLNSGDKANVYFDDREGNNEDNPEFTKATRIDDRNNSPKTLTKETHMEDIVITEDNNNMQIFKNGKESEIKSLKYFEESLSKIAEYVNDSYLDDILKNHIKESDEILDSFKGNKKYNAKLFGYTVEKPLLRFNFDGSFYKGQWSLDLKRNGFGISIRPDGSRYQGTWLNDCIHGVGRFTNINGNYYEGNNLIHNLKIIYNVFCN